jgi:hypothetical protein
MNRGDKLRLEESLADTGKQLGIANEAGRVQQEQPGHALGMTQRQLERNPATKRVSADHRSRDSQLIEQPNHRLCHVGQLPLVTGLGRVSTARQIDADQALLRRE